MGEAISGASGFPDPGSGRVGTCYYLKFQNRRPTTSKSSERGELGRSSAFRR